MYTSLTPQESFLHMRTRVFLIAAAAVALGFLLHVSSAAQTPANRGLRTVDGKPDLNGIWQALNKANWDIETHGPSPGPSALGAIGSMPPGIGVVEGDALPYLPAAAAKKKENFANRWTADPELKCYLPGVPRATYMPYPFQILQGSNSINGHWEGDALVVDVTSFNDQTWFDRAGNFHSEALHVVERYTPISANILQYEATIEDPKVFSRPWKMSMPLYRHVEKNMQLMEYKCAEFAEDLLYGHLRKQPRK